MVERSLSMREVRGSMPRFSKSVLIFLPALALSTFPLRIYKSLNAIQWYVSTKISHWGTSSDGRALASHVRGTGIDAPVLQFLLLLLPALALSTFPLQIYKIEIPLLWVPSSRTWCNQITRNTILVSINVWDTTCWLRLFNLGRRHVRMAERSKAPDSRVKSLSLTGVFWSTYVGVGSNPTSDSFLTKCDFLLFPYQRVAKDVHLTLSISMVDISTLICDFTISALIAILTTFSSFLCQMGVCIKFRIKFGWNRVQKIALGDVWASPKRHPRVRKLIFFLKFLVIFRVCLDPKGINAIQWYVKVFKFPWGTSSDGRALA